MDRKVISWTEQVGEKDDRSILQDRQVILERKRGAGERAWRLVYQKWNRTYTLHDRQEKAWIGADHNSIMQYEEYEYEDNIKVRFKRKWFR